MSKFDGSFDGPDLVVDYSEYHKGEESASPEAGQAGRCAPGRRGAGGSDGIKKGGSPRGTRLNFLFALFFSAAALARGAADYGKGRARPAARPS